MNELIVQPPTDTIPVITANAMAVLQNRYLLKDETGKVIETPAQLFSRVASLVAQAESQYGADENQIKEWHKKFYELLASLKFLPNSPTLMNAKSPSRMLSACFVLPIEDSIEAIFETIKQTALIQKAGGGTGFSLDKLRPTGDRIASSGGTTSGPISFWKVFSEATEAIQQGAFRRGANMGMMSIDHPDILKFLYAKQNLHAFNNFNISVKITDEWMDALRKTGNQPHVVKNPRTQQRYLLPKRLDIKHYTLNDLHKLDGNAIPSRKEQKPFLSLRDIWNIIVKCAHKTGEPGVAFIDRINRDNPTPSLGQIEATNPCGEQPLLAYEACTLGSVNLAKFVNRNEAEDKAEINWEGLAETVKLGVRFLDNIIDVCHYPVEDTIKLSQANRKIGLGVMGFADCLFLLGIPYNSQQGVKFGDNLMKFINETARQASSELAEQKGAFPNWEQSIWQSQNRKVRNASITCVAPTGTVSIIADCTNGIEPAFSLVFARQVLDGTRMLQINPIFKVTAEKEGCYSKKLERQIGEKGSIQHISSIKPKIRQIFKCAYDIQPEWHVKMQAAFQENCDAAVSKTINFSSKTTIAAVDKTYKLAYQLGCKGITIYRRNSRKSEPMSLY